MTVVPKILLSLLMMGLVACGGNSTHNADETEEIEDPRAELRELERQVIAVHDEVMPKMGDMSSLRNRLTGYINSGRLEEDQMQTTYRAIHNLEVADSLMWEWMHNYQRPKDEDPAEEVRAYLKEEMQRIGKVKEEMLSSIEQATNVLDELDQQKEQN